MLPELPQHFGRTANLAHFLPKGFVQLLTTATRVHPHRDRQRRNFLSAVVQAGDGGFELAQPFQQHLILLALRIEFPPRRCLARSWKLRRRFPLILNRIGVTKP
jgi:hypothetical protein